MPGLFGDCRSGKPIIKIGVLPALPVAPDVRPYFAAPEFKVFQCRALLDTGADGTSICQTLANSSGLRSYGKRAVIGVGGQNYHKTWGLRLGFFIPPNEGVGQSDTNDDALHVYPQTLLAIEIPDNQWFEIIIGRDILLECEFSMKRGGTFELTIPQD